MTDLHVVFVNGRFLYFDGKKNFIGYDPMFSEPIPYPCGKNRRGTANNDGFGNLKNVEQMVQLDGETFDVRIKQIQRLSFGGFGMLGMEVFTSNRQHLTTHLHFNSISENGEYGSKYFYHNGSYYLLSSGSDFHKKKDSNFINTFDKKAIEKKHRKIDTDKLYLVKFNTFNCEKPYYPNKTIETIIVELMARHKTCAYALGKTIAAWDFKFFKR